VNCTVPANVIERLRWIETSNKKVIYYTTIDGVTHFVIGEKVLRTTLSEGVLVGMSEKSSPQLLLFCPTSSMFRRDYRQLKSLTINRHQSNFPLIGEFENQPYIVLNTLHESIGIGVDNFAVYRILPKFCSLTPNRKLDFSGL